MPTAFLTDDQRTHYGQYTGEPDPAQLITFFHLDDADQALIRRQHGSHQRLGFALQLGTVRFLGTFLPNPLAVPPGVIQFVAHQLQVTDLARLPRYLERPETSRTHTATIRQHYGYRDFTAQPWHFQLVRWLYRRAWLSNERALVVFEHASAWLMYHKVLLPGVSTLERLIGTI